MYFIIILNVLLGVLITSAFYPIVGIIVLIFCVLMLTIGYNNTIGESFIRTQMKYWGNDINEIVFSEKRLLLSVACLTLSLKIGAAIAIFVETSAVILVAFCIILAFGYLFDGSASGMTIGLSYNIARLVIKIFSLVSIGFDKIAEWIAKIELSILNIKI